MSQKSVPTVSSLRGHGWAVRVSHVRMFDVPFAYPGLAKEVVVSTPGIARKNQPFEVREGHLFGPQNEAKPQGGETRVLVTSPEGDTFTAVAECSAKDHYNKKRGVLIAMGRLSKVLPPQVLSEAKEPVSK